MDTVFTGKLQVDNLDDDIAAATGFGLMVEMVSGIVAGMVAE